MITLGPPLTVENAAYLAGWDAGERSRRMANRTAWNVADNCAALEAQADFLAHYAVLAAPPLAERRDYA